MTPIYPWIMGISVAVALIAGTLNVYVIEPWRRHGPLRTVLYVFTIGLFKTALAIGGVAMILFVAHALTTKL